MSVSGRYASGRLLSGIAHRSRTAVSRLRRSPQPLHLGNNNFGVETLLPSSSSSPSTLNSVFSRISDEAKWTKVLAEASKAVVALRLSNVRSFDSSFASCGQATGFVVDRELGLILTNRHVVLVGPISAEAVFENHEGVVCQPIYRDPIHDFGFLKYDPSKVQYMDVGELKLFPAGAKVGKEIRVLGNDAGEKIMVLRGTISRCDREAPLYGPGYNDHDTFYITAASATSGGSSGSPVIDASGRCIALNAGGATQASTSFFLPLDRVPRALEYVRNIVARKEHQSSKSLSRGTLQVVFKHRSLDDVRRLGLPQQEESDIRAANSAVTGMLIIGKTVPGGNGANAGLKEGDIVLRINQQTVLDFVHLEDILDRAVEEQKDVEMEVQRGAEKLRVSVKAQSLWELIPDEYVEYSRGIFHPLSLNLALGANTPPNSIFVATPGYSLQRCGITSGSLIRQIGDWSIHTLDDLERAICAFPDGTKVPIRFSHMSAPHVEELRVMIIDRKWFPMVRRKRVLTSSGEEWTLKPSPEAPSSSFSEQDPESSTLRRAAPAPSLRRDIEHMDRVSARVMKSMVSVTFNVPFEVDGQQGNDYFGCGVVLDKSRGLILCDRNTVTCLAGDVKVSVASSVELAARPLFLHPTLNVAIVQVNPKLLEQCDVDDLPLFNDKHVPDVRGGDELNFYGLSYQQHIKMIPSVRATSVERANTRTPSVPRFSAKNFDVVHFDQTPSGTVGGVFVDPEGVCRALWSSFYIQERNENVEVFYSTLIGPVRDALKQVQESLDQNRPVEPIYQLGVEFNRMDFAEARSGFGLSDEWIDKISRAADSNLSGAAKGTREVFVIERIMAGSKALGQVMVGDILLACDGHPVVSYYEVDALSRKYGRENKPLPLTVLRNGKVLQLEAKLTPLSPIGTDKVLFFAGLQVQPTHDAVLFHGFCPEHLTNERRGCFISGVAFGSPANSAGIFAVRWIVEANETKVDSLQSLVDVVKHVKHNDCVRLRLQDLQGNTQVVTVRIDHNFWQTSMLAYDNADGQWKTMTM